MNDESHSEIIDEKSPFLLPGKIRVNYLYFGFFFLLLSILHVYSITLIEKGTVFAESYFLFNVIAQCFLETLVLILMASFVQTFLPKIFTIFFVFVTFSLFLSHVLDFPLVRIMDWSIWYVFHFLSQESYANFIEMLYASHISLLAWIIIGGAILGLVFLGYFLFNITEKFSKSRPLLLTRKSVFTSLCATAVLLGFCDQTAKHFIPSVMSEKYQRCLPWKTTLFPSSQVSLKFFHPLKGGKDEKEIHQKIAASSLVLADKPNIYLFVIESLRDDYLTAEVAPNMNRFKKQNIAFDLALSNANATQISWFSIFHSKQPVYWGKVIPSEWTSGGPPLQILKQLGYKINVYSSARLSYYHMDELMFGQNRFLADNVFLFPHDDEKQAYESDRDTIQKLCDDIRAADKTEGNVFVIFLESTHFSYSWPKDAPPRFAPIVEEINYLKAAYYMDDLEKIRNRYRNAIHFIDSLVGNFFTALNDSSQYEDAVIVLTGDHGEEFYEQGHLFHASALSNMQTHVPIYYKFGKNEVLPADQCCKMTSHIDIFPTLLDYLGAGELSDQILDGQSVFKEKKWPYVVSTRYNASRTPNEFFIHNGRHKLVLQFVNEREIFKCKQLRILALKDLEDESVPMQAQEVEKNFKDAFESLFGP